jgi:hypothetical protein
LFAGTSTGVYRSTNNGTNWFTASNGLPTANVYAFATSGINLFAATDNGVYSSLNNGSSWVSVSAGLLTPRILSLVATATHAIAGSQGGGVWRRPVNEVILDVKETGVPLAFALEQNYPNPFNPATRIPFSVRGSGFVSLKVYDILGREVRTIVNENLQSGSYEVTFNAEGLASGVYFYRLQAGNYAETRRMMLAK